MDLKQINDEYIQLKKDLEIAKKEKDNLNKQKEITTNNITMCQAAKKIAELNNNKADVQLQESYITKYKKDLEKTKADVESKQKEWEGIQQKINGKIEELKKNPEMKKHLDEVLAKKYDRQLKKDEAEKGRLEGLKDLVGKHKTVKNNLIGMTNARKEIAKLNIELKKITNPAIGGLVTYTDPAKADDILKNLLPAAKEKYNKNMKMLKDYAKTQNVELVDNEIESLVGSLTRNKGNIRIEETINKAIKGKEKHIANYRNALNGIDKQTLENIGVKAEHINTQEPQKQGFFKSLFARFKSWRNRNTKALPEGREIGDTNTTVSDKKKKSEFADSLKYDIVREEVAKMEKEGIMNGKQQRKQQQKSDNER